MIADGEELPVPGSIDDALKEIRNEECIPKDSGAFMVSIEVEPGNESQLLSKWANEVLHVLDKAKRDGIHLKVKNGKRGPFEVSAEVIG